MPVKTWYIEVIETGQIINSVTCESQELAQKTLDRHTQPSGLRLVSESQVSPDQVLAYRLSIANQLTGEAEQLGLYEE